MFGIGSNCRKAQTAFSLEERLGLLKQMTQDIPNVEIVAFSGLLVDCSLELEVDAVVRSLRNVSDFDYEILQSQMNRRMGNIETLFILKTAVAHGQEC